MAADVTLYAQWTALPTHTVTFDPNGGTGTLANQVGNVPTALTANTFTRAGFTFAGWGTASGGPVLCGWRDLHVCSGRHAVCPVDGAADPHGDLRPQRRHGPMANQVANVPTALTANTFTRAGYNFTGWSTDAGGGGTAYANGANYDFSADITLYAQWTPTHPHRHLQ